MRVVVAAMGRLVPELALLARELASRFDTLVLLGCSSRLDALMTSCARPQDARFGHWSTMCPTPDLERQLAGADVIVHLPMRVEEAPAESLRQRSMAVIAEAVRRLGHRRPRRIVSLISTSECDGRVQEGEALSLSSDVMLSTVRVGLVLRSPGGALQRAVCALRAQAAMQAGSCNGLVQWIHELDGARAMTHILERPWLMGQLNLTAPFPVTVDTFAHALWRAFGLPSALEGAGASVARLLEPAVVRGPAAEPRRLLDSGFGYLFPELDAALADLSEHQRS